MKQFLSFSICFIAIFSSLNVFLISEDYSIRFSPEIEQDYIDDMNMLDHEVILLGDSLLYNNLDMEVLNQKIGKPVQRVIHYGSASALWFLMLKNYFAQLDQKPETVIIFFRDTMLTSTTYHTEDEYFDMMDEYASDEDVKVLEMIQPDMSGFEKVLHLVPIMNTKGRLRSELEEKVRLHILIKYFHRSAADINSYVGLEFDAPHKIRRLYWDSVYAQISTLYSDEKLSFDEQINDSFLPLMIKVAEENGIRLCFVRFPVLENQHLMEKSSQLNDYNSKLASYFSSLDIPYLDMADMYNYPRLLFFDPVHMNKIGQTFFTQQLIKEFDVHNEVLNQPD